jgi:hypothetical protein
MGLHTLGRNKKWTCFLTCKNHQKTSDNQVLDGFGTFNSDTAWDPKFKDVEETSEPPWSILEWEACNGET